MNPFQSALKWFLRMVLSFLVITALLVAWTMIQSEFKAYDRARSQWTALHAGKASLENLRRTQEADARQWLEALSHASAEEILIQIKNLEEQIRQKEAAQGNAYDKSVALLKGDITPIRHDLERLILKRVQDHLQRVHEQVMGLQSRDFAIMRLEVLRREHQRIYEALQQQAAAWEAFRNENYREVFGVRLSEPRVIPFTADWERMKNMEAAYASLYAANQEAHAQYQRQAARLKRMQVSPVAAFRIPQADVDAVLAPLNDKLRQLGQAVSSTWAGHFAGPVTAAIPVAAAILLMALLTPLVIKTFFYYAMAPLVSRGRAICLLPETPGDFACRVEGRDPAMVHGAVSAVSQVIHLDAQHELLIHPEYLQSASVRGEKDTQWLFNWRIPLTSLFAGLIALTRIRSTEAASYVLSSTRDPLSEVAVLALPAGSAVVIHPRALVGLVQERDAPAILLRRWQLNRLNAWLTLQLRYFVFQGPVTLLVKGCRGVRVEPAQAGRSINQAAMIGFSANLRYAPRRCETFVAYLRGKSAV
jgi:hypothetical protein